MISSAGPSPSEIIFTERRTPVDLWGWEDHPAMCQSEVSAQRGRTEPSTHKLGSDTRQRLHLSEGNTVGNDITASGPEK